MEARAREDEVISQTVKTPTGPLLVVRPVAERLLAEGVITGQLDGDLRATDAATVKAAMMTHGACDFCAAIGAPHDIETPDFEMTPIAGGPRSTGGWGACDTCMDLVRRGEKKKLLDRAVETAAFGKWSRQAIAELHKRFWDALGRQQYAAQAISALVEFVENRVPSSEIPSELVPPERAKRIGVVSRLTGLAADRIEACAAGRVTQADVQVIADWRQRDKLDVKDALAHVSGVRKPFEPILPHWQVALDRKFAALKRTRTLIADNVPAHYYSPNETDLNDPAQVRRILTEASASTSAYVAHLERCAAALRIAETYSFSAETAGLILAESADVPCETPLSAVETPGGGRAGWFWFAEALPVMMDSRSPTVQALLWYWRDVSKVPELAICGYVLDAQGTLLPVGWWAWKRSATIHQMLGALVAAFDNGEVLVANDEPLGREEMIAGATRLSQFFLAACVWMQKKILVGEQGHVERHARKRIEREHKVAPTVQVIALRKSYRERLDDVVAERPPEGAHTRDWSCRWWVGGVFGFPRLQACGPGLKERRLIWVDPFVKGPKDKPLRTRDRVYAVVR